MNAHSFHRRDFLRYCTAGSLGIYAVFSLAASVLIGQSLATADDRSNKKSVARPDKQILFQPMFLWEKSEPTYQGTGFFCKTREGRIVAITSSHFFDFKGPHLQEARWLNSKTGKAVASFTKSLGPAGDGGTTEPDANLRRDYLIMPVDSKVPDESILELDDRRLPEQNEKIKRFGFQTRTKLLSRAIMWSREQSSELIRNT